MNTESSNSNKVRPFLYYRTESRYCQFCSVAIADKKGVGTTMQATWREKVRGKMSRNKLE